MLFHQTGATRSNFPRLDLITQLNWHVKGWLPSVTRPEDNRKRIHTLEISNDMTVAVWILYEKANIFQNVLPIWRGEKLRRFVFGGYRIRKESWNFSTTSACQSKMMISVFRIHVYISGKLASSFHRLSANGFGKQQNRAGHCVGVSFHESSWTTIHIKFQWAEEKPPSACTRGLVCVYERSRTTCFMVRSSVVD